MVNGHTYSEQLFESEAFRHFANIFLNKESGVTKGCEITQTSTTIEIGQGFFVILGGLLEEDTGTSMSIPTDAGYFRLVYEIDLSKVNTEAEFNQGSYKFVKGVGSYSNLTQEDLDNNGNVYQFEFCRFRITESGLEDFQDTRKFINYGVFVKKSERSYITAWNSSTQSISNGNDYQLFLNTSELDGNYFKITEDGKIKVLKDCIAYLTSKVFIDDSIGEGYVMIKTKVNNEGISASLERIIDRDYTNCVDSGTAYNFKANDVISVLVDYTSTSGNPKIRSGRNFSSISIFTI